MQPAFFFLMLEMKWIMSNYRVFSIKMSLLIRKIAFENSDKGFKRFHTVYMKALNVKD